MNGIYLNRHKLHLRSLSKRRDRVDIEKKAVFPASPSAPVDAELAENAAGVAEAVTTARKSSRPVVLSFGAHTIKNGLSPLLMELISNDHVTHLATNGAGIIHDWEFAYQGTSSEHVAENVSQGRFGLWEETGFYLNLALCVGAYEGRGYGQSVGSFVENDGLLIPSVDELETTARNRIAEEPAAAAAALDLLERVRLFDLKPGFMEVPHPYKRYGLQAAAYRRGVSFTSHPMFGHDIIYCHPMSQGAAIGRTAERDFLQFAEAISRIEHGVYISIGSAVMSPMIFEKSFSMAQNLAIQNENRITNHKIFVVDLVRSDWDWATQGEPPEDNPAYYLRFLKSFSRMGGSMKYIAADNRLFLQYLLNELETK